MNIIRVFFVFLVGLQNNSHIKVKGFVLFLALNLLNLGPCIIVEGD